jgi:hypothetical protein
MMYLKGRMGIWDSPLYSTHYVSSFDNQSKQFKLFYKGYNALKQSPEETTTTEVMDVILPIKKRKFMSKLTTTTTTTSRKQRKKCNYYEDFDSRIAPKYRVALYDRFLVLSEGQRPGLEVTIHGQHQVDDMGNIMWNVSTCHTTGPYWSEYESNLELL